jgi:hypothetical protein
MISGARIQSQTTDPQEDPAASHFGLAAKIVSNRA